MSDKMLKRIVIVLAVLTVFNLMATIGVSMALNAPQTNTQIEVLGTTFKLEEESNTLTIDLIRPPRTTVAPGEKVEQKQTLTNTADFSLYFRAIYEVRIEDANGAEVQDFESDVTIVMNDNWYYKEGYWYYDGVVKSGMTIDGPIASIEYSAEFAAHRDYKVYVPLIIESVEMRANLIHEVDYWPNKNIAKVDHKRMNEKAEWTQKAEIIIQ